jgi:hypothetical protein
MGELMRGGKGSVRDLFSHVLTNKDDGATGQGAEGRATSVDDDATRADVIEVAGSGKSKKYTINVKKDRSVSPNRGTIDKGRPSKAGGVAFSKDVATAKPLEGQGVTSTPASTVLKCDANRDVTVKETSSTDTAQDRERIGDILKSGKGSVRDLFSDVFKFKDSEDDS